MNRTPIALGGKIVRMSNSGGVINEIISINGKTSGTVITHLLKTMVSLPPSD